ncbi:MAG: GAF domain-containing protein [Acidobacteriia bacterium]|nr:GAF domain-containing protein [Terriglobia bacterium]
MSATLVTELERLADALGGETGAECPISLATVAERLAKALDVQPDEVAILALSGRTRQLQFLSPEKLRNVGSIPASSTSSLAARTARENRPEIVNNFPNTRHASVFEGVPLEGRDTVDTIQKIISAPILAEGKVIGVLQVSRKGTSPRKAGPDFTQEDLGKVLALCRPLGKLLPHFLAT